MGGGGEFWGMRQESAIVRPVYDFGETSERWGGVHMGFSEHKDTILK